MGPCQQCWYRCSNWRDTMNMCHIHDEWPRVIFVLTLALQTDQGILQYLVGTSYRIKHFKNPRTPSDVRCWWQLASTNTLHQKYPQLQQQIHSCLYIYSSDMSITFKSLSNKAHVHLLREYSSIFGYIQECSKNICVSSKNMSVKSICLSIHHV